MKLSTAATALAVAVLAIPVPGSVGSGPAAGFSSLCGAMSGSHPARVAPVMFIVEANRSFPPASGRPSAPYIHKGLVPPRGLEATVHNYPLPFLSNYLALTSGAAGRP